MARIMVLVFCLLAGFSALRPSVWAVESVNPYDAIEAAMKEPDADKQCIEAVAARDRSIGTKALIAMLEQNCPGFFAKTRINGHELVL